MDERYRLEFTARARADLLQARRWLTQPGSGLRAQLRLARINRAIIELEFAPLRWAVGRHPNVRVRLVEGHSVHYSVDRFEKAIVVRRVFSPYQDQSIL
ncbi:type II toxin-antitoxin system RelE/ParE family toxin [Brevundimonas staleyi]|uniref:Type II toxin-antitoxin system RelE/ParE family toxin n=1 Tax=Brevundimonas staleyi TaxID=74326 RepID=A0ABW0FVW6_9CAUL